MTATGKRPPPDGLRLALTTFTILPLRPGRADRTVAGRALLWCPLVGAGLGGAAALPTVAARPWLPGPTGAFLLGVAAVSVSALLTRGLHLDGLADVADGLGSGRGGQAAGEIMKRPDIGPFGVVTLTLTLLAQTAAASGAVSAGRGWEALVLAGVTGRLAVLHAATPATPPLRTSGLGAMVAGTVSVRGAALWTVAAGALCLLPLVTGQHGRALHLLAALAAGLLAAALLRRHAVRRFGGVSGDVFGAVTEAAATAVLVAMAVG